MQVTNPPIDPLREGLVMSLEMRLGARGNLLQPNGDTYRQVRQLTCISLYTRSWLPSHSLVWNSEGITEVLKVHAVPSCCKMTASKQLVSVVSVLSSL